MAYLSRIFAVINPHSANRTTGKEWPSIRKAIEERAGPIDFAFTSGPLDATRITREALKEGYDFILSVGGDGNNNETVNGFFEEGSSINPEATLGIVCHGTGGDFRRTFGWDRNPISAIDRIFSGPHRHKCDLGVLSCISMEGREINRYFINIASFGVAGLVDDYVNRSSKALGGRVSFLIGTLRAISRYRNQTVSLSVDGETFFEGPINNIAVANGRFFGGGMMVAPLARVDDALFDIVILGDVKKLGVLSLASRIYKGKHLDLKFVQMTRGREVTASSAERVLIDMDGEQPGSLPATFKILPQAIYLKTGPEGISYPSE